MQLGPHTHTEGCVGVGVWGVWRDRERMRDEGEGEGVGGGETEM